jgi:cytochrome oxidase Cu insertion factor (SCO1/SenC/PrrC family)
MKRKPYRSPYFWAIVAVVLVVAVAWAGRESYQPILTGVSAPDFAATTLDGRTVHLSDYRGRVVLVNVWATWTTRPR